MVGSYTSVKLVSDSHSDSFSDSKMHNCKSKTKLIHEIQGGARGATYGLLNCVKINFRNRDNQGKLRVESAPTRPFARSNAKCVKSNLKLN